MNIIVKLSFLYVVGSLLGWVLEVLFRRFISTANPERKWINPGFLKGPYLPLYGVCLCVLYMMAQIDISFVENVVLERLILFLVMSIIMTAIEYITGYIFIVCMKIRLWDYSDRRGNIKGIICPLFSFFWAVLGAIYYFFIHPYAVDGINWFSENLLFAYFIGLIDGFFIIDIFYSFNLTAKIRKFAKEKEIIIKYELLKQQIRESVRIATGKDYFFKKFNSDVSIKEHLTRYFELREAFDKDAINRVRDKFKEKTKK